MGAPGKSKLDDRLLDKRLEAYFATLRSSALKNPLKRSAGNWQIYAAVTGSALAMATGASAALIGSALQSNPNPPEQVASVRMAATPPQQTTPALAAQAPSISPGGVVPIYGTVGDIQPGEWITIYGSNLAATTTSWAGDFPTSLGGVTVTINGKAAYLMYVSPGQINAQAPDDTATGTVAVAVTTAAGVATSTVTLSAYAPSFSLVAIPKGGYGYVAGTIIRSDGSGAFAKGTYDVLGPTGSYFGYRTVAAKPGDLVELYGVGLGPTTPAVPSGTAFSGAAPIDNTIALYINNIKVTPSFVGLSSAGLYQINLTVPAGLGEGEVSIQAMIGTMQTQWNVLFSLRSFSSGQPVSAGGGSGGSAPPPFSFNSGGSPGSGGSGGGGGGSSDAFRKRKPYIPKMQFPPK